MKKLPTWLAASLLTTMTWAQNGPTIPEGTPLKLKLESTISSLRIKVWDPF